jgi:hypothetical protein
VTFRLDTPHDYDLSVWSETTGAGAFLLTLEGPGGEVLRYEGAVGEDDAPAVEQGTLAAGVYRLRQVAGAQTLNVRATADWNVEIHLSEQAQPIPLPPAAVPGLLLMGTAGVGAVMARVRRRLAKS